MAENPERKFVCCICCTTYPAVSDLRERDSNPGHRGAMMLQPVSHARPSETSRHLSWESVRVNLSKPTMTNLQAFPTQGKPTNILLLISDKAPAFCTALLKDEDGSKYRNIENKHKNNYQEINREVLERWLQGGGKATDWTTLVRTLRDVELGELAKDIELTVLKWKQRGKRRLTASLPA